MMRPTGYAALTDARTDGSGHDVQSRIKRLRAAAGQKCGEVASRRLALLCRVCM